jgi:hypothetical protein
MHHLLNMSQVFGIIIFEFIKTDDSKTTLATVYYVQHGYYYSNRPKHTEKTRQEAQSHTSKWQ